MGWNGVGKLIEVEGKMYANQYCEILDERVVESFEKLDIEKRQGCFQQDNDPKHTSWLATTWFSDNDIIVFTGLLNLQTSIPLNPSGIMSSANFKNMRYHQKSA